MPITRPTPPPTVRARAATIRLIRAPWIRRLRMSRPKASVPRMYFMLPPSSQNGGSSLSPSVCSMGECGASSGAKMAMKSIVAITSTGIQGTLRIPSRSREPDARIDIGIENVDHEVDGQDQDGLQHYDRLQERKVAVDHCLIGEAADPGPGEHRLGHDRAGDEIADEHAPQGQHRNQGISQAMLPDHHGLAEAFDAGELDILTIEHLEHARPRQAHEAGGQERAE